MMDRQAKALKGQTSVRPWVGCDVALVDKRPMEVAPRTLAGMRE